MKYFLNNIIIFRIVYYLYKYIIILVLFIYLFIYIYYLFILFIYFNFIYAAGAVFFLLWIIHLIIHILICIFELNGIYISINIGCINNFFIYKKLIYQIYILKINYI